jgi:hypothetical protein
MSQDEKSRAENVPALSDRTVIALNYENLSTFIGLGLAMFAITSVAILTEPGFVPPVVNIAIVGALMPPAGAVTLVRQSRTALGFEQRELKHIWVVLGASTILGLGTVGTWWVRQQYGKRLKELGMSPKWYGVGSANMTVLRKEREEQLNHDRN